MASADGCSVKHEFVLVPSIGPLLDFNATFSGISATSGTLFADKRSDEIEEARAIACKLSCKGCRQINVSTGVGRTLDGEDETISEFLVCSVTNGGVSILLTVPNPVKSKAVGGLACRSGWT